MITPQNNLNEGLMGYTPEEVEDLAERGKIPRSEAQNWFNGYSSGGVDYA